MKLAILLSTCMLVALQCLSQKGRDYRHEFRITTENDNYMFTLHDGYYTNGLFLHYSSPSSFRKGRLQKIISEYRAGQMIFISESFRNARQEIIDRPISGYLFIEKGYSFFFPKGHLFRASATLGTTGEYSLAQQVQSWYHEAMNLPRVNSWPYQLSGEFSLNLSGKYYFNIPGLNSRVPFLELTSTGEVNIGNAFTNAVAGMLIKFGDLESPWNSSYYNAATGNHRSEQLRKSAEVFVYYYPQLMAQFYNATVQGPLFKENKGPIVAGIEPWVYLHQLGVHYSEKRWSLDLHFTSKRREATSMRSGRERFAAFTLGYRFGQFSAGP